MRAQELRVGSTEGGVGCQSSKEDITRLLPELCNEIDRYALPFLKKLSSIEALANNLPETNSSSALSLSPDQEVRVRTGLLAVRRCQSILGCRGRNQIRARRAGFETGLAGGAGEVARSNHRQRARAHRRHPRQRRSGRDLTARLPGAGLAGCGGYPECRCHHFTRRD